jgi:hypothetical protein
MLEQDVPEKTATRITNMRHSLPSTRFRRLGALTALAVLVALASVGLQAHADTQLPTQNRSVGSSFNVAMTLDMHGQTTTPRVLVRGSEPFAVAGEANGKPWRAEFSLKRLPNSEQVRVAGRIIDGGETVAAPVLVGSLGQKMTVRVGDDVSVALIVTGG